MSERVTFAPEVLEKAEGVANAAFESVRAILLADPRWKTWTDKERVLHHFIVVMNVAGGLMLHTSHALASCGGVSIEEMSHYLDDWTAFQTQAATRVCAADFEVGIFFRVKKHDGECGEPAEPKTDDVEHDGKGTA